MDLKHITKAELYRQLCKEQEKVKELEEIVEKSAEHAHKQAEYIDELEDSMRRTSANAASLVAGKFALQKEVERLNVQLDEARFERDWLKNHPWKNLFGMEVKWDE